MKTLISFFKKELTAIVFGFIFFISAIILEQFVLVVPALVLYIAALLISGGRVFVSAVLGILRLDFLDEKFLMSIASVGAMIVGEWSEGVAVMLFFLVGETFEHAAVRKSRGSIRALMDICPDEATLVTDVGEEIVDAGDVPVGSTIVIRPGERVPIDCIIIDGSTDVDTSSMTGESIPRSACEGDTLASGTVVLDGLVRCRTLRTVEDSAASRVLSLVESAHENKAKEESFITKFSRYYTPAVVISAVLLALIPPAFSLATWGDSVYRALIFLVISCPCALVISVPMAFFGGIGGAASRGILFKGGGAFSPVARTDTAAFDKTGTVTSGRFTVVGTSPCGVSREELLSLAASAEYASNHPIAECIKSAAKESSVPTAAEEIAGEGIVATVNGSLVGVGNPALMSRLSVAMSDGTREGVHVCRDVQYVGTLYIADEVKPEAASAIAELRSLGVRRTAIISGDREGTVRRVGGELDVSEIHSELTPEKKYECVEQLLSESRSLMYVGDGINDAPSLARAHVGVAMGGIGQDSAIEAADVVIVSDNLKKIPEAIRIARKTVAIAKENIVFALGAKGLVLVLGALGIANMWLAVFADVGVAVLAILNSMRALRYSVKKK